MTKLKEYWLLKWRTINLRFVSISTNPTELLLVTSNNNRFGKMTFIYDFKQYYIRKRFFVPISLLKSIFNISKSEIVKNLSMYEYEYIDAAFWKKIPQTGGTPLLKNDIIVVNEGGINSAFSMFGTWGKSSFTTNQLFGEMVNIITNTKIINAMDKIENINKEILELITILPEENRDHTNIYHDITRKLDKISNDYKIRLFQQL